ncbi:hydrogenase iron-sulfur subunit [Candidatus Lokiarchaeum ossiferum]|uniref:hydrogenase iron-sulfur subunit n=1 Tax=Candidatus Lokiarchaeum ossiferum TaxID=2951803 RepID=UPI00352F6101
MTDTIGKNLETVSDSDPALNNDFEPFILGIFCNWCTYTGCDQAGTSRMQRPANLRVMRVMCSGRVEPAMVLAALKRGVDGVLVGACHIGDCHYVNGNHKTVRRIPMISKYIQQFGINPNRVWLRHISASEGAELTEIVHEYVKILKNIGPNPFKKNK